MRYGGKSGIDLFTRQRYADDFCFQLSMESPRIDLLAFAEQFIDSNRDCPIPAEQLAAIGGNARGEWHAAAEPGNVNHDDSDIFVDCADYDGSTDNDDEPDFDGPSDFDSDYPD